MDIMKKIAAELGVRANQVEAAVKLIDEGCTIPFIARYRKEVTGSLNDEVLRDLYERLTSKRRILPRSRGLLRNFRLCTRPRQVFFRLRRNKTFPIVSGFKICRKLCF